MTTLTEVKETEFIVSNISLVLLYLSIPLLVGLLKLKKKKSVQHFIFPNKKECFPSSVTLPAYLSDNCITGKRQWAWK